MPKLTEEARDIMEEQDREQAKRRELAARIMILARDQLMISMRFLDRALFRMPMVPTDTVATYGVDGRTVFFNTDHVLRSFQQEKNRCERAFLHMIFHCIFSHPVSVRPAPHQYHPPARHPHHCPPHDIPP